jgi:acetylornithine deacetylase/succinyl-diaminopimelate desuccinylase-like protein
VTFGTWPGWCEFGAEVRLVPGMDREEVQREVEEFLAREAGDRAEVTVRWLEGSQGWMAPVGLSPESGIVRACQAAARRVFGHELPVAAYPGGTDATYLMGEAGIPTVAALGPGWLSVAHGANECIGVGQIVDSVELYSIMASIFLELPPDEA